MDFTNFIQKSSFSQLLIKIKNAELKDTSEFFYWTNNKDEAKYVGIN